MREEEREEKIKKLRELSKKDRKEIEEAHSLVKGTEDIIKEKPIKSRIIVPEIEPHIEEIIRQQPRRLYGAEEEAKEITRKKETRLEETVETESREKSIGEREAEQVQYNIFRQEFNEQKTEDIYNSVRDVYQRMRETGLGPSSEDMDKINAARYVAQKREEEIGRGDYGRISQEVSEKLVLTEKMGSWISRMYRH